MASLSGIILWRTDCLGLEASEDDIDEMKWRGSGFECDFHIGLQSAKDQFFPSFRKKKKNQRAFCYAMKNYI